MQTINFTLGKVRAGLWAMEAARLESGSAGRFVAFFCNKHDSAGTNGPQHYCKLSYEVTLIPISTGVAWHLGLLALIASTVTSGGRSTQRPINVVLLCPLLRCLHFRRMCQAVNFL